MKLSALTATELGALTTTQLALLSATQMASLSATPDRAFARLDPLEVVVELAHHRLDVPGGEGFVTPLDDLDVLL